MSGGNACRDPAHRPLWRVTQRHCNHSAFNGYHYTPSAWSSVVCTAPGCTGCWRTKAAYVYELPDYIAEKLSE
jgi:hypothetical protein